MANIHIARTTLLGVCWGVPYLTLTLKSIVASLKNTTFDEVIIVTDCNEESIVKFNYITNDLGIRVIQRHMPLKENVDDDTSRQTFSEILLNLLSEFCSMDFILTIQPDSCIISSDQWTNEFLNYDYIGAPWPMDIVRATDMASNKVDTITNLVGNGGFSLRSKRYVNTSLSMPTLHKNEDLNLCVFNYDAMINKGIKFAPIDLAYKFSVEHPTRQKPYDRKFLLTYNSFGFHGEFNIAGMKYIHQNSKEVI